MMLWLLFFGHQAIVFVRAGLRSSWLANALRLVGRSTAKPAAEENATAT
jgi:hypothetical protein